MSFLSRVLDATINPESKAVARVEDKVEPLSLVSSVVDPLPQAAFRRLLSLERKTVRALTQKLCADASATQGPILQAEQATLDRVVRPLGTIIRETDTLGWFESDLALGVIFSELGDAELGEAAKSIESKVLAMLHCALNVNHVKNLEISIYSYHKAGKTAVLLSPLIRSCIPIFSISTRIREHLSC